MRFGRSIRIPTVAIERLADPDRDAVARAAPARRRRLSDDAPTMTAPGTFSMIYRQVPAIGRGRLMLRVTTLYASSAVATAAYYTRYLAEAPGEEPGGGSGRQADGLGLAGRVEADDLQLLLEGRDPSDGTPLGSALVDRQTSDGRVVRAVAGFDATFSAPKSLSVWWALTGDPGLLDAHDVAVTAALEHLERYGATTRVRRQRPPAASRTRSG